MLHNAVAGFDCLLSDLEAGLCRATDAGEFRDAISALGAASGAGNVAFSTIDDVFLLDPISRQLGLTSQTPMAVRRGGMDGSQSVCGVDSMASCGAVLSDIVGTPRTCPQMASDCYSIGAYELD